MDTPGIHLAKKIDKMGMKVFKEQIKSIKMCLNIVFVQWKKYLNFVVVQCSDTAVIYFDDVRVPAKNIIGEEGGSR